MSFQVLSDLRAERAKKEVLLSELSAESGVSEPTLSKLFSGKSDNPTLQTVCDIAAALGLEVRAVREGALDELPGNKPVDVDLYNRLLAEKDKLAAQKDRIIATQKVYVRVLFSVILAIVAAFAVVLILDRMNGDWGYFRYLAELNDGGAMTTLAAGTPVLFE